MSRAKRWCFTLNNPAKGLDEISFNDDEMDYLVYQLEAGASGTPHLQGYVEFKKQQRLTWLITNVGQAHWTVSKGTAAQNKVYCTKEEGRLDGPREYGEASTTRQKPGKRNDLEACAQLMSEEGLEAARQEHPGVFMRYHTGLKAMNFLDRKRKRKAAGFVKPKIVIYWGKTGAGKTSRAFKEYPDLFRCVSHSSSGNSQLWMDGYEGEKEILFDDFYGGIKFHLLLEILDGYPMWLPFKGGFVMLESDTYIFTSNVSPEDWYPNVPEEKKAALRRRFREFGRVEYMGGDSPAACINCDKERVPPSSYCDDCRPSSSTTTSSREAGAPPPSDFYTPVERRGEVVDGNSFGHPSNKRQQIGRFHYDRDAYINDAQH